VNIGTYTTKLAQTKVWKYAHLKRDGHFTKVICDASGRVTFWSKLPKDITPDMLCVPCARPYVNRLPTNTVVLCELWLPGKRSEAIKTAINALDPALRCDVFAVERYTTDLRNLPNTLPGVANFCSTFEFPFVEFVELPTANCFANAEAVKALPVGGDVEGYVLKNGNLADWVKVKPRRTVDVIVTGFTAAEPGKYEGLIGALIVSTAEGYEVANVSGMSDVQRQYFSEHSESILGSVIEVEYQNVGAKGRLRHPAFIRTREDKAAKDCVVGQDEALAEYWKASDRKTFTLFE
jgi:hypothetical protein